MVPVLAAIGLADVSANVLFGLASTRGLLAVVSVLASLYPVVTVALARIVLGERLAVSQRLGGAGAIAGPRSSLRAEATEAPSAGDSAE